MSPLPHSVSRRAVLLGSGALFAWTQMPRLARAEGRDPRMLVIILRGALDGLGAVAPVGDPDWFALRGDRALMLDGATPALPLNSFFALNPAMPNLNRLYKAERPRSCMRPRRPTASDRISTARTCWKAGFRSPAPPLRWLNRALLALESEGRVDPRGSRALGVGSVMPLVVRGSAPVMSWVPQKLLPASDDTQTRLLDFYHHTDPKLAIALQARMKLASLGGAGGTRRSDVGRFDGDAARLARVRAYFADAAGTAARYLAQARWPARRRDGLCRLGYPHATRAPRRPARQSPRCARRRLCGGREQHGRRLAGDRRCRRHGVRAHRAHQRHARH